MSLTDEGTDEVGRGEVDAVYRGCHKWAETIE